MWRSAEMAWIELPSITEYGWEADGIPVWTDIAFPDDITELLVDLPNNSTED